MVNLKLGRKAFEYFYALLIIFLLWYMISQIVKINLIPSPILVLENLSKTFKSKIMIHVEYSLFRILMGIALSLIVGVPTGIVMGYFRKVDKLLSPIVYLIYPIPKIALLPVVMLIFGLGEMSKIFMIAVIVVFQVIVSLRDAVKGIPENMYYSIYSLGGSLFQLLREVIIPASLINILTSIRVALGTAISVLFFTETFGTEYGIGYFIMDSWMRVNYLDMYSGIIVLSLMGIVLFSIIDFLEFIFYRW
ncbi:ABC transporter permease [Thermoanaerobacterium thermosaccharolyticum]|uniref:ABC transporter permease n=2 Tax=Thermoanaerobacterium thermosaccharolyticum TaxID=1517 RepID=A0A231VE14_THETR|nr:ABC transporter permease [Thermoanaerobacterium thermosaccharolyticum]